MKTKFDQQKELLQNAANDLKLTVKLIYDYSDMRKNPGFCIYLGALSISGKMDYMQANMFLLGYRNAIKYHNK